MGFFFFLRGGVYRGGVRGGYSFCLVFIEGIVALGGIFGGSFVVG